jgi:hypothetical protein
MLDVFNGDAFNTVSLTTAINKLPYAPGRLGQMGLFGRRGITTLVAVVEERHGVLMLIPTAARGTMPNVWGSKDREARAFPLPHLPLNAAVMADDVQGVRAFGSDNAVEGVATLVNDKLAVLKQSHEITHEYHRIGAIQGVVLDADGSSELYNFFTEFSISESTVTFDFTGEVKLQALEVIRTIEDALGATPYRGVVAMCGNNFFDSLVTATGVKDAFDRWNSGAFFRDQQNQKGFDYAGIRWENYRGSVGSVDFIDTDTARFFPTGVPGLFEEVAGPANFIETVNTVGKPYYAKQERMKFDVGVELHTQSNVLLMCTRPAVLIKGETSSSSSGS